MQHAGSTTDQAALTVSQTAAALGCSTRTVRNLIDRAELRAFSVGLGNTRPVYRITAADLHDYIESRRIRARGGDTCA